MYFCEKHYNLTKNNLTNNQGVLLSVRVMEYFGKIL